MYVRYMYVRVNVVIVCNEFDYKGLARIRAQCERTSTSTSILTFIESICNDTGVVPCTI